MRGTSEHFRIAGAVVRVDWRDEALRGALGPALAVRAVPAAAPDLVINAGVRPDGWPAAAGRGLGVTETGAGLTVVDPGRRMALQVNPTGTAASFTCATAAALPEQERAAPFRLILQRGLRPRAVHLLHAAAVGLPGHGAVLLAARGGGGKSNATLACLTGSPLRLLGEDYVAVEDRPAPRVWSLYNTAKLHPADLTRFPGLAADADPVRDAADGKAVLQLAARHAGRWADGLPLRAILVLKITAAAASRILPAAPPEAVKAMLTSLLMVLPDTRRPLFEFTARLARTRPVYRLELGGDPRQTADMIHRFLIRGQP